MQGDETLEGGSGSVEHGSVLRNTGGRGAAEKVTLLLSAAHSHHTVAEDLRGFQRNPSLPHTFSPGYFFLVETWCLSKNRRLQFGCGRDLGGRVRVVKASGRSWSVFTYRLHGPSAF